MADRKAAVRSLVSDSLVWPSADDAEDLLSDPIGIRRCVGFILRHSDSKGWAKYRVLAGLFCLASVWMTLCGPATESYTYVILAPATILALVQSFNARQPAWLRALVSAAFVLQLFAVTRASFLAAFQAVLGTFDSAVLSACIPGLRLFWLFNNSFWPEDHKVRSIRTSSKSKGQCR